MYLQDSKPNFIKVIKGQLYISLCEGEFPPILLGFELALHRHHKTMPQGIKWCWCIFQVIYYP